MKSIKISLAAIAIVLGTGAAFATKSNVVAAYGFNQTTQEWEEIAPHYRCDTDPNQNCTATGFSSTGQPLGVIKGDYVVLP